MKKLATVNRLEVIDHTKGLDDGGGRTYIKWEDSNFRVRYDIQDDGHTIKIFISSAKKVKP